MATAGHPAASPEVDLPAGGRSTQVLTATATYALSDAGRAASLLAGDTGHSVQRVDVAVPVHRLRLIRVTGRGMAVLRLRPRFERTAVCRAWRTHRSGSMKTSATSCVRRTIAAPRFDLRGSQPTISAALASRGLTVSELSTDTAEAEVCRFRQVVDLVDCPCPLVPDGGRFSIGLLELPDHPRSHISCTSQCLIDQTVSIEYTIAFRSSGRPESATADQFLRTPDRNDTS